MVDILHTVELTEDGFFCANCNIELPAVAAQCDEVIDMNGAGVHWLPAFVYEGKAQPCERAAKVTGTALVRCTCEKGCEICNWTMVIDPDGTTVETSNANEGDIKPATPLSEPEKMAHRMGFANFQAMREASKPND